MKYARTATLFFNTPLAILPAKAEEILGFWQAKLELGNIDFDARQEPFEARYFALEDDDVWEAGTLAAATGTAVTASGSLIAVVPLHGVMAQRMNMMQAMSGGTSTQMFAAKLRELVNDPQVKAIIVDADSPGGSVYGVDELATEIHALRDRKPIVAVANSLVASAAYYALSNASEFVVTPGGEVGSVGVIAMHVDQSKHNEMEGVKPTIVTAGKYKAELNPHMPLSDEAHATLQAAVDRYYGMFISAVARGREVSPQTVREKYGQGRVFGAQDAVRLGMADRIATLDETIRRFASGGRVSRKGAVAEAEMAEPCGHFNASEAGECPDCGVCLTRDSRISVAEQLAQRDRDLLALDRDRLAAGRA